MTDKEAPKVMSLADRIRSAKPPTTALEPVRMIISLPVATSGSSGDGWRNFNFNTEYTIGEGDAQKKYERRTGAIKNSIKWGQLKLFVTELDFFTRYIDFKLVPKPFVVSVGAAPGTHTYGLARMFPMVEFHLYDPREFDEKTASLPNVKTYQKFFTDEDVAMWAGRKDVFFICDIRNLKYDREMEEEATQKLNEQMVMEDMALQASWVEKIRPVRAQLKFRLPYTWDFNLAQNRSYTYFDGVVYRQPWASQTSTECRLVPFDDLRKKDWDYSKSEEQLYHHNAVVRETHRYRNPFTGKEESPSEELGITNDWDSICTMIIISDYLKKFGLKSTNTNIIRTFAFMIATAAGGKTTLVGIRSGDRSGKEVGVDDDA